MVCRILALILFVGPLAGPGEAIEYRLRVANLYDKSVAAFIDGRIGLGQGELAMPRLEASLDAARVPAGALLGDRPLRGVPVPVSLAFGAVPPAPAIGDGVAGSGQWYEVAWSGAPGERTLWAVVPDRLQYQRVTRIALRGTDEALRYYLPYSVGIIPASYVVARYPLGWLLFHEEHGSLRSTLDKTMRLPDGIAVVVGDNGSPQWADWVYFLVENPPQSTTFKAVVAWERRRGEDRWDAPGRRNP